MARNGSGVYSPPSGNPVSSGTTVTSSWANNTISDIGNEITNSLPRDGSAPLTGVLKLVDGAVSAPSITFSSETSSGLYRKGTHEVVMSIGGINQSSFSDTGLNVPAIGATTPGSGVFVGLTANGNLAVVGNTAITGNTILTGTLAAGASSLASLGVTGVTTLTGNSYVLANLAVAGLTTASAGLNVTGTTAITGAATISSTLSVAGTSTLTGAVNAPGGITGSLTGTAASATLAVKASTISSGGGTGTPITLTWSGIGGQPTWLFGGEVATNVNVYNPANFSVNYATTSNYANSAGSASNSGAVNSISGFNYSNRNYNPPYLWATAGSGSDQFLVTPANLSVNYATTCNTSNNTNAFQGAAPGYFINNGGSAVVNIRNDGSTGLRAGIGGYGDVVWNVFGSDERLKENIQDSTQDSLALINTIDFKSFQYKTLNPGTPQEWKIDDGHVHTHGVIAQQIQASNPEWVNTGGTYLQPNVDTLVFSLLKAVQQLSAELDAIKASK